MTISKNLKKILKISLLSLTLPAVNANAYWTDRYDVQWDSQSKKVVDNMPVGAGDMNCNVWVQNDELLFYIQRSGSFTEIGEYIKLGRVRLSLSPNPFKNSKEFSQKLILKDGYLQIQATGNDNADFKTNIKLWVDQFTHSVNITIDSEKPIDYTASYESWRTEDKSLVDSEEMLKAGKIINSPRWGASSFLLSNFEVIKLKDDGFKFDKNAVLFYHRNPKETLSPNYTIKQQGLEDYKDEITNVITNRTMGGKLFGDNSVQAGTGEGKYELTNFKALKIKSKSPSKKHHIYVATHIAQTDTVDEWLNDLDKICKETISSKGNFEKNAKWWNQFWDRSWIIINPDNKDPKSVDWQMGCNYNLMRYQFGGNAYGEFPTKFNGGSATVDEKIGFDPDWRKWGGEYFTGQNQRLIYWPMLKSGDFDMMDSQFQLYVMALPGATARVKDAFGHSGAAFSENTGPSGTHPASEYGYPQSSAPSKLIRGKEVPFGDKSIRPTMNYGKPIEKGVVACPSTGFYYTLQIEFSYMILQRYEFMGQDFEEYMPLINASLKFYDEHYQARNKIRTGKPLDDNGKIVIYPSTAGEKCRGVTNPTDIIVGLEACLESLINADVPYISKADKKYYKEFLDRLPPIPFNEVDGLRIISPAQDAVIPKNPAVEVPMYYAMFPYNKIDLLNEDMVACQNVWKTNTTIRRSSFGWSQIGIFTARMGIVDDSFQYQREKLADTKNGRKFPTYWGPNYDGTPDYNHGGAAMIGLQEMLMQTFDKKILLFPAWDKNIDVDFKLHAPYNTTVDVSLKNGKIQKLIVTPKSRQKDVILDFPFKPQQ